MISLSNNKFLKSIALIISFQLALGTLFFGPVVSIADAATGVPSIMAYQGRLTDSSGSALGGDSGTTYYFKFSIWDNATVGSGSRLWPSSAPSSTSSTVTNGVFSVNIGDTGYPTALDYNFQDNKDVYLQVEASSDDATFETLSPRQRITSAGFAINSGTLLGFTPSQTPSGSNIPVLNSGDLLLSGTNPQLNATSTNTLTLQGGGGTGAIQFFSSSNNLDSSGNLTIAGSLSLGATTTINTVAYVWPGSDGTSGQALTTNGSGTLSWATIADNQWINSGSTIYASTTATGVGIGTTNPSTTLDILGTLRATGATTLGSTFSATGLSTLTGGFLSQASSTIVGPLTVTATTTLDSNLILPVTTATAGAIYSSTSTLLHTFGTNNYFSGIGAGNFTLSGAERNVGIGPFAAAGLTSGDDNVLIGYNAGNAISTGLQNTFIGSGAGDVGTTFLGTVAIGYGAAGNATGDVAGIFIGGGAGDASTVLAQRNIAIGSDALKVNTSGDSNIALGWTTLDAVTTGTNNVAVGDGAGGTLIDGTFNTFLGQAAANLATGGTGNIAIGLSSGGAFATGGDYNIAAGTYALEGTTTGDYNVALGYEALEENIVGNFNVAIGYQALDAATSTSNNVAIGYKAGSIASTSGSIFIGAGAGQSVTADNRLYIDNSSTTNPLIWGDFANDYVGINTGNASSTLDILGTFRVSATSTFSGATLFAGGSATLPSISLTGDTNTGFFSDGADALALSTGGTERFRVNSSGQASLGVNSSGILGQFDIYGVSTTDVGPAFNIETSDTDIQVGDILGTINFRGKDATLEDQIGASIHSEASGLFWTSGFTAASLIFKVDKGATGLTTVLTIDNLGKSTFAGAIDVSGITTFNTVAYTWPGSDGSSGQFLSTNGAGTLSWASASGGGTEWTSSGTVVYASTTATGVGIGTTNPSTTLHVVGDFKVSATTTLLGTTTIENLNLGATIFETDAGIVSWVDLPISSASATSTIHSYSAQVDGTPLLTIYGESDGSGGLQNQAVGVGTTTPTTIFHSVATSAAAAAFERLTDDGTVVSIRQANVEEGTISVSGATVSYNAFTGSHYALPDDFEEELEKGYLVTLTGNNQYLHENTDSEIIYGITKSSTANDSSILGSYLAVQESNEEMSVDNPVLVMAVGNGDIWVADNGEDIQAGDFLISSEVPGHAMLDDRTHPISYIIGRASESILWEDVSEEIDGAKHKRISVLFEYFARDNSDSIAELLQGTEGLNDGSVLGGLTILRAIDTFESDINVKGHAIFNEDSVGQAKIKPGDMTVRIDFEEEYKTTPIITATVLDTLADFQYAVMNVSPDGFNIDINSNQPGDTVFSWHAFASSDNAKIFSSDGSESLLNIEVVVVEPEIEINVPESSNEPEEALTEETPAENEPAAEDSTEEEVIEETPAEEEEVVEEVIVEEDPVEETPAENEPAAEDSTEEEVIEETPAEEKSELETPGEEEEVVVTEETEESSEDTVEEEPVIEEEVVEEPSEPETVKEEVEG